MSTMITGFRIAATGMLHGATVTLRVTGWNDYRPYDEHEDFAANRYAFYRDERTEYLEQLLTEPTYWLQARIDHREWKTLRQFDAPTKTLRQRLAELPRIPSGSDDDCPGGCGETERCCTCAETASWKAHNADPATRGSYWTA